MDTTNQLRACLAATAEPHIEGEAWLRRRRRRFLVEMDRHGLFLRLGRTEAYLCGEPAGAWSCRREPGGFDAQAWRLHLIVGQVPPSD